MLLLNAVVYVISHLAAGGQPGYSPARYSIKLPGFFALRKHQRNPGAVFCEPGTHKSAGLARSALQRPRAAFCL
ncbi:hypothetical protein [Amantichitinum ursilacus]|uniref:hypothetical protein n=1 Tax=Amantichitinum ursilacus TaxID=857265 RepID=UPI0006B687C4|nr:hypothetical protein [Amantichitinum ursilacus]